MKTTLITGLLILSGTVVLSGCSNNAQNGALIGSLVGAGIGKSTSNHRDKRAAIGAVLGGAVGAAIGAEKDRAESSRTTRYTPTYDSSAPATYRDTAVRHTHHYPDGTVTHTHVGGDVQHSHAREYEYQTRDYYYSEPRASYIEPSNISLSLFYSDVDYPRYSRHHRHHWHPGYKRRYY